MSQFQNRSDVFPAPGGQDPLSSFSQWGNPFSQARSRGSRPVPMNSAGPSSRQAQSQLVPYTGGISYSQPSIDPLSRRTPSMDPQPTSPFAEIDQTIAGSVGFDMSRQQAAADYQFGRMNQATEGFMGATQDAARTMQGLGADQRTALQGIAGGLEQQGQKDFDAFAKFRDQQLGGVNQRLNQMGSQMEAAVQKSMDVERQFRDTSAQDAANAGFGIGRNAAARNQEIEMMGDLSPGEKAALKQQNWMETQSQTSQVVSGIFSNMNQQMAQLGQMTASMKQTQAGMTAQGAQIAGQVGTAFGAQTLEAQKMGQQMRELGSNMRVMGEQAYASLASQASMLLASGQRERYDMYMGNPYQPISVFAGLTGFLNAATTPGIENINLPDFRGYT